MSPVDHFRPFEQRLNDFGPELGPFLRRVWENRASIDLVDFEEGSWDIYKLYSAAAASSAYDPAQLKIFLRDLRQLAGPWYIVCQSEIDLSGLSVRAAVAYYGPKLWDDFFHVLSSPRPARPIRSRVYVHAADATASVRLMRVIVGQFGKNPGLWEVKTAGPGSQRLDTIVCYLYDAESADELASTIGVQAVLRPALEQHRYRQLAMEPSGPSGQWLSDSLPPLVKRVSAGIGVADEPPAVEIYKGEGDRHSFGSFFSTLCWVALKTTPDVLKPNAEPRHMLDNMLYSLRLLDVDPANPQRFPKAAALEAWYEDTVSRA